MSLESESKIGLEKMEVVPGREMAKKSVFVSHTHADRELVGKLKWLIEKAYSGMIRSFISSDPTPGGGIQPGDVWFQRIQAELVSAEAVWVVATKASAGRPWIYWEAGLGRAICPGGVIILRVGLLGNEVYSPLDQFQSYDGSIAGAGGIGELLTKVGQQIGMDIPSVLVEAVTDEWLSFLGDYQPNIDDVGATPIVSAEQVGQMAGLVARLETVVSSLAHPFTPPQPFALTGAQRAATRPEVETLEKRIEMSKRRTAERVREREWAERVMGPHSAFFDNPQALFDALGHIADSAVVKFAGLDADGDAAFVVEGDGHSTRLYLRGSCLLEFDKPTVADELQDLVGELERAIEEAKAEGTASAEEAEEGPSGGT